MYSIFFYFDETFYYIIFIILIKKIKYWKHYFSVNISEYAEMKLVIAVSYSVFMCLGTRSIMFLNYKSFVVDNFK